MAECARRPYTAPLMTLPAIPDAHWDAGDLGCGELLILLRARIGALPGGAVLHLTARDRGAVEDLPAWCALTGHRLLRAEPPHYTLQRKEA